MLYLSAVLFAVNSVIVKIAAESFSGLFISSIRFMFGMITMPFTFGEFTNITASGFILLFLIGLLTFVAQILMTYGYKEVPASKGSMIFYLETILTIFLSLMIVDEIITTRFIIGCTLVILGLVINNSPKRFRILPTIKPM
jgi:drug/metabolite transporter (DMT)-like permease